MKWNIGWGITSACNMNCGFCYSKTVRSNTVDVSKESCYRFIDENHQYINSINYGTGENSLVPEWYDLVDYIKTQYNVPQALTTNGYISQVISSDKDKYSKFVNAINEVDISIDYADEYEHCRLRGNSNVFKWAIESLRICKETEKSATIVFVGMRDNLNEENIEGLFDLARKYNAKLRLNLYRPTGGINEKNLCYIPSYKQIINILKYIHENHKVLSIDDNLFGSILVEGFDGSDPSGVSSLRILPNGDITPSTYLITSDFVIDNIKTKNVLHTISPIFGHITCDACKNCKYHTLCGGGVMDRRYLWYGSADKCDPYCPIQNGWELPDFKIILGESEKEEINSIHHGYLPTMFFLP